MFRLTLGELLTTALTLGFASIKDLKDSFYQEDVEMWHFKMAVWEEEQELQLAYAISYYSAHSI